MRPRSSAASVVTVAATPICPRRCEVLRQKRPHVRRDRVDVLAEPLRQPHRADVDAHGAVAHDQLGRAAADVEDERVRVDVADTAKRHGRLLLAGEQARDESVAPLDLAQEGLAVLGVAHCARRDGERPLRAERLELAPVLAEHVADARDRQGQKAPPSIDSLSEPGDPLAAHDLVDAPVLDVGDEHPGRVRPDVYGRDADHLRGYTAVNRRTEPSTSCTAA